MERLIKYLISLGYNIRKNKTYISNSDILLTSGSYRIVNPDVVKMFTDKPSIKNIELHQIRNILKTDSNGKYIFSYNTQSIVDALSDTEYIVDIKNQTIYFVSSKIRNNYYISSKSMEIAISQDTPIHTPTGYYSRGIDFSKYLINLKDNIQWWNIHKTNHPLLLNSI